MTYRLFGSGVSPYVRKVRVVMAEKALSHELVPVNPMQPSPEFRSLSPLGKIPVLVHERDGEDVVVPDSSIICDYLEHLHPEPSLVSADPEQRARTLWLEEHADGGAIPKLGPPIFRGVVIAQLMGNQPDVEGANRALRDDAPPLLDYYERELGDAEYFVGDRLSLADIAIASPFVNFAHAGATVPVDRWPRMAAFLERMLARPSFAACLTEEEAFRRPADLDWGPDPASSSQEEGTDAQE